MFDVNKLPGWKSALDEGFRINKSFWVNERDRIDITITKETDYTFKYFNEYNCSSESIMEKDFETFCQKVAVAVLEVQE